MSFKHTNIVRLMAKNSSYNSKYQVMLMILFSARKDCHSQYNNTICGYLQWHVYRKPMNDVIM